MSAISVPLPATLGGKAVDWENADFDTSCVWGTGNNDQNVWGWQSPTTFISISNPVESDGTYSIIVTLRNPDSSTSEQLSLIARYNLDDGTTGTFGAIIQFPD